MTRSGNAAYKIILFLSVLVLSIVLVNVGFGLLLSSRHSYFVWPPKLHKVFKPDPRFLPGITGPSRFYINSAGVRGEEFSPNQTCRILAIGGSTTESLYVDGPNSWPALLEEKLNAAGNGHVWVGNVGKSGMTSRDHVMQIKYLLPEYPKIDIVIVLVGINDLMMATCDTKYDPHFWNDPDAADKQIAHAFSVCPYGRRSLFDSRGVLRVFYEMKRLLTHDAVRQDDTGQIYETLRQQRRHARQIIDTLPDLRPALEEYRRNLDQIIDTAQSYSVRLIFMTQPSLWKDGMTRSEEALLWKGRIGAEEYSIANSPGDYYSVSAMKRGMEAFNHVLLETCRARKIECIDLAAEIPKSADMFYDEVHFNDAGSKKVAEVVYNQMQERR